MRILVDIRHLTSPKPSGVGEYTKNILRALFALDTKNAYVLLSTGSTRAEEYARQAVQDMAGKSRKVQHVHVRIPNKLLNLRTILGVAPSIQELAGGDYHVLFLPNLAITNIPKNLPTILTIHDLSWKIFPHFFSRKMLAWHKATKPDHLVALAKKIITPSLSTKQDVERMFQKIGADVALIHHGIDAIFTKDMQPQDHGVRSKYRLPKRFALFMGTLEPRKNVLTLIDGMEAYRKRSGDDIHLVLAGKWGWKPLALTRRILDHNMHRWIHHLGYVPTKDRPALYRAARVFVWPSFYEGFGLPVLESMACGTPVITSYTSSIPEITGNAAVHIDPFNHLDISTALEQLFDSKNLQTRLHVRGLERAKQFSWTQAAQKTLRLLSEAAR